MPTGDGLHRHQIDAVQQCQRDAGPENQIRPASLCLSATFCHGLSCAEGHLLPSPPGQAAQFNSGKNPCTVPVWNLFLPHSSDEPASPAHKPLRNRVIARSPRYSIASKRPDAILQGHPARRGARPTATKTEMCRAASANNQLRSGIGPGKTALPESYPKIATAYALDR